MDAHSQVLGGFVPLPPSGGFGIPSVFDISDENGPSASLTALDRHSGNVNSLSLSTGYSSNSTPPLSRAESANELAKQAAKDSAEEKDNNKGRFSPVRIKATNNNLLRPSTSSSSGIATSSSSTSLSSAHTESSSSVRGGSSSSFSNWLALAGSGYGYSSPLASFASPRSLSPVSGDPPRQSPYPTQRQTTPTKLNSSTYSQSSVRLSPSSSSPSGSHSRMAAMSAFGSGGGGSVRSGRPDTGTSSSNGGGGGASSFASPPLSGSSSMQSRSPIPGGKASQMLGMGYNDYGSNNGGSISGNSSNNNMPMSATQTFNSMHSSYSDSSKSDRTMGHHHPASSSPGTSSGKMTLKKARSLFSSKSSKLPEPIPDLPSPTLIAPNGGGSSRTAYPYGNSLLSHSKSYGSLVNNAGTPHIGNGHSGSSEYRFPSTGNQLHSHGVSDPRSNDYYYNSSTSISPGSSHPYAASSALRKASIPNIERRPPKIEEHDDCPVCLESLSIRLAGEKPHVVPVCGHKLHADCFEAAYGHPADFGGPQDHSNGGNMMGYARKPKKKPIGICGVCRGEMRLGDAAESGKSKFAAISGQPGHSMNSPPLDTHKLHSISKRTIGPEETGVTSLHDPSEDQDIVNPHQYLPAYMQHIALGSQRAGSANGSLHGLADEIQPIITVRAEHASIARPSDPDKKVHLTCMVTVEIPSRVPHTSGAAGHGRGLPLQAHGSSNSQSTILGNALVPASVAIDRRESNATSNTNQSEDFPTSPSMSAFSAGVQQLPLPPHLQSHSMEKNASSPTNATSASANSGLTPGTTASSTFTPNSTSAHSFASSSNLGDDAFSAINASSTTLTAAAQTEKDREAHGPFADVFDDLQARMADWKGHEPAAFGSLRMHDSLQVKKDKNVREFVVYLFEEALLCVVDDRKKASIAGPGADRLRLKGRVFVKHMKQVEETSSVDTGLSLTISMEDDSLESFVILFATRGSLEVWRSQIQALIDHNRPPVPTTKAPSMHSAAPTTSKRDSIFSSETNRSDGSRMTKATTAPSISGSAKDARSTVPDQAIPPLPSIPGMNGAGRPMQVNESLSNWTPPDPNTYVPIDLMLVLSIPHSSGGGPSSSALKLRLIRSTLDFIVHAIGPRARISIVTFSVGDASHATMKKTPWLSTGRSDGLKRLEQVISEIVGEPASRHIEGLVGVDPKEEKITVASAVNLALDIILQRQVKSATSGMILMNDGRDGAQKHQIDLVMARAEASAVPIHCFGWGKSHDPSSLWLLSNHTRGTYTFVRDFYQLKDAMAGCIGGMLSVAVSGLRLHLNVQERKWFKIRKVSGVGTAIVSADGKDVDINLGEIRYGEKKEMLVEIEMASPKASGNSQRSSGSSPGVKASMLSRQSMTATDDFFMQKVGLDPHSLGDLQQDFYDEIEDGMADDVPIFEVNASYRNPLDLAQTVSKLPYPALLTTTVTPPPQANGSESPTIANGNQVSDPTIVRRRMELLTSDMVTRSLLLMSRRQDAQAQRLLTETTRIFAAIIANLVPPSTNEASVSQDAKYANEVLLACLDDIETLRAGCGDRAEFDSVTRNYGAQQAVALRDQRAWTDRTATEALFFNKEWTAMFGNKLSQGNY